MSRASKIVVGASMIPLSARVLAYDNLGGPYDLSSAATPGRHHRWRRCHCWRPSLLRAVVQVTTALERLIDRHGRGNYADHTLKLTFPRNPNGLYLLKGGGRDVWSAFGIPPSWRKRQGLTVGKRCGTTENIGSAARHRWSNCRSPCQVQEAVA